MNYVSTFYLNDDIMFLAKLQSPYFLSSRPSESYEEDFLNLWWKKKKTEECTIISHRKEGHGTFLSNAPRAIV